MRRFVRPALLPLLLNLLLALGLCCASAAAETNSPSVQKVRVQPVSHLRADFMMGADVSMLTQIEELGGRYADAQGRPRGALALLKDNGINWIRLRLWHTPLNAEDVISEGKLLSRRGEPVGGGNNDLARTVRIAKRAKAMGFKLLLDLHYSDFWADPKTQTKPAAWQDLHGEALEQAVHDYTREVLARLAKAGALPNMVQVGNEIDGGLLWPDGKTFRSTPDETIGGEEGFARLLASGIRAVREANPKRPPRVAIHLANGGDNTLYQRVFDLLTRKGLDYDLIGLSFYPYWHGSLADLRSNLDDISSRYGKPVAILETAYGWTTQDGDGFANLFSREMADAVGYRASPQGQASLMRDLIAILAEVPGQRGVGLFYWEPAWIPQAGAGWRTGEGNAWDNQAMFDFKGRALPSLSVFRRVRQTHGDAAPRLLPQAPQAPLALSTYAGEPFVPPSSVRLGFDDDAIRELPVSWDEPDPALLAKPGQLTLRGQLIGRSETVEARLLVEPRRNLFPDPGFERLGLENWVVTGNPQAVKVERNPGNAHASAHALHYWLGEPFRFEAARSFSKLQDGHYTLRAWAAGGGGERAIQLFARDCGDEPRNTPIHNTGWQKWQRYELANVAVKGGQCTVGVSVDAQSGNWGDFDDFEFIRDDGQP